MTQFTPLVSASLLAADLLNIQKEVELVTQAGADWLHIDVMDGHFVPNITFGMGLVQHLKRIATVPLDVHLMITPADPYLEAFVKAGADFVTIHPEAGYHLHRSLTHIRALGAKAGVALNPATPLEVIRDILPAIDLVLIMSVNPGYGGQSYIAESTNKIRRLKEMIQGYEIIIQVDGGINEHTAAEAVQAGATCLVAGSSIFAHPPYNHSIDLLKRGSR